MGRQSSNNVGQRPASDVSVATGIVGLAALCACLVFAHFWPFITRALAISAPAEPLSGPVMSLVTMLFVALMMGLWAVLVEKVHRNASTGIDWTQRLKFSETREISFTKLAGLWITWGVIAAVYCLLRFYWDGSFLFAMNVLSAAALPLFLLSIPYVLWLDRYLVQPRDRVWHFGAMLTGAASWDRAKVAEHWRGWAIKGFFGAFMLSILPGGFAAVVERDYTAIFTNPATAATALIDLIFVIDVQIGTVGYLLTLRPLDAHIRSGNPFLGGWVAALICYPPFVWGLMGRADVLSYQVHTSGWASWTAMWPVLGWIWAVWLVGLTAAYAWATMAFGIRFSNLTYRGVVTNGPYRFTRHPAYLSKNIFWWCSVLPFLVTNGSLVDSVRNTALLGVVSAIYYWRARTEEDHLLREDAKYRAYYDWMAQHGCITRRLEALWARFNPFKSAA
ncbi:methyltransferase family protein [Altericroceibacterium endophyticum]|uniref:DUF1295 domain-containing protein n=1 Tax=Altericroceibacterium endophyticum TaxID=1808508 RepID=A0A6I4T7X3_9SPHN|nr:DUF1295 domain-containing protein [Altericroceibacterium endophyticum]MXO66887.1 DUF1295 domain-containing protein [Altericroceibacterium endophyticum]